MKDKSKKYDHSLVLTLGTNDGRYEISCLADYKEGVYVLDSHVGPWMDVKNAQGEVKDSIDNGLYLTDTILPALTTWKKKGIEPEESFPDYNQLGDLIPKEDRKEVRRLIKDAILKGFFKPKSIGNSRLHQK